MRYQAPGMHCHPRSRAGPVTSQRCQRGCCCGRRQTVHDHQRRCALVRRPHSRPIAADTISLCSWLRTVNRAPILGEPPCQRRASSAVLQLNVTGRPPAAAFAADPPQLLTDGVSRQSLLDRGRQSGLPCADCIMSSKPRDGHLQRRILEPLVKGRCGCCAHARFLHDRNNDRTTS